MAQATQAAERSLERVNSRNGYRELDWDTRVGIIEFPKVCGHIAYGPP